MKTEEAQQGSDKRPAWRKRWEAMGWGAFMFFLLKGLAWLAVFYGLWSC